MASDTDRRKPLVDFRHEALIETTSTNTECLSRARSGDAGNLWVTAGRQTVGRGRRGRQWASEPGNLYASLLLIDPAPPERLGSLPLAVAVAVHQAVRRVLPPASEPVEVKWPNDILIGRKKTCGILIEGESLPDGRYGLVIGIGINVSVMPENPLYPVTCLREQGASASPEELFAHLYAAMADALEAWDRGRGIRDITARWRSVACGIGEKITVNLPDRSISGQFAGIDDSGLLMLDIGAGRIMTIAAGESFSDDGLVNSMANQDELVFLPLGGVGEIGMNLALYGYGPKDHRQWIMVDCGVTFPGPDLPGVDLVLPDIRFLAKERKNLKAIIITHAHEDHYGALNDLWPGLNVPVYASGFTAGMLEAKRAYEKSRGEIPITPFKAGDRINVGPFSIEGVAVNHSIPEPMSLMIRTPLGNVVHTGDWKIDHEPSLGPLTDEARFRQLGDEGVLALMCDSTNAMRDGVSPSEKDVSESLRKIIENAEGRVAITTFSSNVGRIRTVAEAAEAAGREILLLGSSLKRVANVARDVGLMEGVKPFIAEDEYGYIPRDKVVVILTGSQGEPRAALAKLSRDEMRNVALTAGDIVVFSSRAIPGNEKAIQDIKNGLVEQGIHIVTDNEALVHVSGHPRRNELQKMYQWIKPKVLVPVHGEAAHLVAQKELAEQAGIKLVPRVRNGDMLRLAPGPVEVIADVPHGRIYKDGSLIGDFEEMGIGDRKKLSFAGHVAVGVVLDSRFDIIGDPDVVAIGLPIYDDEGDELEDTLFDAVVSAVESIPRARRKDLDMLQEAVRRAVRSTANNIWGKKPVVTVFMTKV